MFGREGGNDFVELRVSEKATDSPEDVVRQELPPDKPHQVALQVRRKQLRLFIDGQRIAIVPFQPEKPIEGLGFYWDAYNYDPPIHYRDAPVLLTDLRVATYSGKEQMQVKGATAQLILAMGETKLDEKHPLRETLRKFGAAETNRAGGYPCQTSLSVSQAVGK